MSACESICCIEQQGTTSAHSVLRSVALTKALKFKPVGFKSKCAHNSSLITDATNARMQSSQSACGPRRPSHASGATFLVQAWPLDSPQVRTACGGSCTSQRRRLRQHAALALQQREIVPAHPGRRPQNVFDDSRLIVVEGRNDMTAVLRAVDSRVRSVLSASAAAPRHAKIMQRRHPGK